MPTEAEIYERLEGMTARCAELLDEAAALDHATRRAQVIALTDVADPAGKEVLEALLMWDGKDMSEVPEAGAFGLICRYDRLVYALEMAGYDVEPEEDAGIGHIFVVFIAYGTCRRRRLPLDPEVVARDRALLS